MENLAMFYNAYQSANSALEKISGVLEEQPSVPEPTNPVELAERKGHLHFDDVSFEDLRLVAINPDGLPSHEGHRGMPRGMVGRLAALRRE